MGKQALDGLIQPVVASLGYELWGIEFAAGAPQRKLRIFIEHDKGITLDDCEQVSRHVSQFLDVHDPISGEYHLEISSPGLDRRLFTLLHFKRYCGHQVLLKLMLPVEGKRKCRGLLCSVEDDVLTLNIEGKVLEVAFSNIDRASLIYQGEVARDE